MIRLVTLVHLAQGASPDRVSALETAVAALPEQVPAVRYSHLGRHSPRGRGGGEYTWDAVLGENDPRLALEATALDQVRDAIGELDAVAFQPQERGIADPTIGACVKRTLFLRVLPETPAEEVERFERDMIGMADHIDSIRNWAFSRPDPALFPTRWTHVWEQEYADVHGLEQDYMMHPYHWGFVDGWFDPEMPQRIVDRDLAHVYCPTPASILAWT